MCISYTMPIIYNTEFYSYTSSRVVCVRCCCVTSIVLPPFVVSCSIVLVFSFFFFFCRISVCHISSVCCLTITHGEERKPMQEEEGESLSVVRDMWHDKTDEGRRILSVALSHSPFFLFFSSQKFIKKKTSRCAFFFLFSFSIKITHQPTNITQKQELTFPSHISTKKILNNAPISQCPNGLYFRKEEWWRKVHRGFPCNYWCKCSKFWK